MAPTLEMAASARQGSVTVRAPANRIRGVALRGGQITSCPKAGVVRGGAVLPCRRRDTTLSSARRSAVVASAAGAADSNGEKQNTLSPELEAEGTKQRGELVVCKSASTSDAAPESNDYSVFKKVIPLGMIFFLILFNYTILRDSKDVLVITAPGSGAETIPFLKTWVNLPMAIGFMLLYTQLSNVLGPQALFYTCLFPFVVFFAAFAFFMYPMKEVLHPSAWCDNLLAQVGERFMGPISIVRNWTFCLFYVMAELWGSVVVSVLFWGFSNQIMTVDEAKSFYPLFGLGANVALVFSGRVVKYFSEMRATMGPGVDGWGVSLKYMMGLVAIFGVVIAAIYAYINKYVVNDPSIKLPESSAKKKEKLKMNVGESLRFLARSRYIRDLAFMVVAYGISINIVEVTWKSKIKAQFPNPNEYSAFMGDFSSCTGAVTFCMMLASRFIFQKFGWGVAAQITPAVLFVTGACFFSLVLFTDAVSPFLMSMSITPLLAAVYVGAAQNIFSKSAKYSLFDPCKEMAYIPLDTETKVKGKAAIDVVCNPLGKSGGALIQQFLILYFGSLAASTPILGTILLGIVVLWLVTVRDLDKQFTNLTQEDLKEKIADSKTKFRSSRAGREGQDIEYRSVSVLNQHGFIEGKYIPVRDTTHDNQGPKPAQ